MELKKYQKRVLADLQDYLDFLQQRDSLSEAYRTFWEERGIELGSQAKPEYKNTISGAPHICYKVPTGGGKTFLACASLKPITESLPATRTKVVVWLVPSESILTQTIEALKNPSHPYRRRLNSDFSGRVEVYSKEELLAGQNFNPVTVQEVTSIMVLSYDSFRTRKKEGRLAFQANGNLETFRTAYGLPELPADLTVDASLSWVIQQLNPIVVVDESHHAESELSVKMLEEFNPSFILDLTATPKNNANIISYVNAWELKRENMVKLPVIAYNLPSQSEVMDRAINLQRSLEVTALEEQKNGGEYIRPIVLFQAEPKSHQGATSFEKLKEKLTQAGIPQEQIAIKTADVNELKNVNLMDPSCEIRFIITVNALKEGWDCPFAYVLASLANKSSQVDVEQILGRILRLPHARRKQALNLNMSYVLTSSSDFSRTLENIVAGLNQAGFSAADYRVADASTVAPVEVENESENHLFFIQEEVEEFLDFDPSLIAVPPTPQISTTEESGLVPSANPDIADLLKHAQEEGEKYEKSVAKAAAEEITTFLPDELKDTVNTFAMNNEFKKHATALRIPQFFIEVSSEGLFEDTFQKNNWEILYKSHLASGFRLVGRDSRIDVDSVDEQIFRLDVGEGNKDVPKAFRVKAQEQRAIREYFATVDVENQEQTAAEMIYGRLRPINYVADSDLKKYIRQVVGNFDETDMASFKNYPMAIAEKVEEKIKSLLEEYLAQQFYTRVEEGKIQAHPHYYLPEYIQLSKSSSVIGQSLYEGEDSMNKDEFELATRLSGMDNVLWWHRNISRKEFQLNGPLTHYPDFMVATHTGKVILVESKGAQLNNPNSALKLRIGKTWANLAGSEYRYFMVFQDGVNAPEGAHNISDFFNILKKL